MRDTVRVLIPSSRERDDLRGEFSRNVMLPTGFLARLGECGFACRTTETLDSVASVEPESLCFGVFAANAGHWASPFDFLREKPYTEVCGFTCGLRPRLNLARS